MSVWTKLAAAQAEVAGGLEKSQGSALGYNYHGIESLLDRIRPLFTKYKLLLIPSFRREKHEAGRMAGTVTVTILDTEDLPPEDAYDVYSQLGPKLFWAECYVECSNSGRSDGKGPGIAMSYGVKNILLKYLQIGDGKEDPEHYDVSAADTEQALKVLRAKAKEKFGRVAGKTLNTQMKALFKKTAAKDLSLDEIKKMESWVDEQQTETKETKDG